MSCLVSQSLSQSSRLCFANQVENCTRFVNVFVWICQLLDGFLAPRNQILKSFAKILKLLLLIVCFMVWTSVFCTAFHNQFQKSSFLPNIEDILNGSFGQSLLIELKDTFQLEYFHCLGPLCLWRSLKLFAFVKSNHLQVPLFL